MPPECQGGTVAVAAPPCRSRRIALALVCAIVSALLGATPAGAAVVGGSVSVAVSPQRVPADGTTPVVATVTVRDALGNPAAGESVTVSRSDDPSTSIPAHDNGDGTYTASFTASTTGGDVTVTGTDTSGLPPASNQATFTQDATPPAIALNVPADGATYRQGEAVAADYSCSDPDGAGDVASCAGDVASGDDINTSTPGDHTFTVNATDQAGNATQRVVRYTVAVPQQAQPPQQQPPPQQPAAQQQPATATAPSTIYPIPAPPDRLRIVRGRVEVRGGLATVPISCQAAAKQWCRGTLVITGSVFAGRHRARRKVALGSTLFAIVAGRTVNAVLALSRRAMAMLGQAKGGRLSVTAAVTDDAARPKRVIRNVTLVGPPDRHVTKRPVRRAQRRSRTA